MKEEKLQFSDIFNTSEDLPLANELRYVCGKDTDECLPFDEIIAKATVNDDPIIRRVLQDEESYQPEARPAIRIQ